MCDFIIDVMSDMKSVIATKDISRKQADVSIREKIFTGCLLSFACIEMTT